MTPEQVSAHFEGLVSVRTLANWRWSGKGPPFTRVGGKIMYPRDKLIEWEQRRTVNSTSEYRSDNKGVT